VALLEVKKIYTVFRDKSNGFNYNSTSSKRLFRRGTSGHNIEASQSLFMNLVLKDWEASSRLLNDITWRESWRSCSDSICVLELFGPNAIVSDILHSLSTLARTTKTDITFIKSNLEMNKMN